MPLEKSELTTQREGTPDQAAAAWNAGMGRADDSKMGLPA